MWREKEKYHKTFPWLSLAITKMFMKNVTVLDTRRILVDFSLKPIVAPVVMISLNSLPLGPLSCDLLEIDPFE